MHTSVEGVKSSEGFGYLEGHVRRDGRELEERLHSIRKKNTEVMIDGLGYEERLTRVSLAQREREDKKRESGEERREGEREREKERESERGRDKIRERVYGGRKGERGYLSTMFTNVCNTYL